MTFSIVARCPETLALDVYVSTAVPALGSVLLQAESGVGAQVIEALAQTFENSKGEPAKFGTGTGVDERGRVFTAFLWFMAAFGVAFRCRPRSR